MLHAQDSLWLRHPALDASWRGRCYGQQEVPLAPGWQLPQLPTAWRPTEVISSGLTRTDTVAALLAVTLSVPHRIVTDLRERDFGAWEGRPWDEIYQETGSAMDGMMHDPAGWAPPGGETTWALRDRVLGWWQTQTDEPRVILSHAGPIACLVGTWLGHETSRWWSLSPAVNHGYVIAAPSRWAPVPTGSPRVWPPQPELKPESGLQPEFSPGQTAS